MTISQLTLARAPRCCRKSVAACAYCPLASHALSAAQKLALSGFERLDLIEFNISKTCVQCWPLLYALIAAVCIITLGMTPLALASSNKSAASSHRWPFSQALIAALQ